MLTALVLFDVNLTLRARLAIEFNVIYISRIFLFFVDPVFILFTRSWNMTFLITFKTETISTLTIDVYIGAEGVPLH